MQTGSVASAVITAAHQTVRQAALSAGMVVVDDPRHRSWTAVQTGNMSAFPSPSASAAVFTATGTLTSGLTYSWVVVGKSGTGYSFMSNSVAVSVSGAAGQNGAKLAWSGIPQATSYSLYRSSGSANTSGMNFMGSSLRTTIATTGFNDTAN